MDRIQMKQVKTHKHLGVTIQSNGKWTQHINEITSKASKKVDQLRSLMHKIDKLTLQTMYMTYIRPLLEYASIVWCNCSEKEKKLIEDVQLAAARVVTSATKGTSHNIIYNECKWELLEERRKKQRLCMLYKMKNGLCPERLRALLPTQLNERMGYNLRGRNNFTQIKIRTNAYSKSFLPSAIQEWNNLDNASRDLPTLTRFKKKLGKPKLAVKTRFLVGSRTSQIMLSRIKLKCSGLNEHLFLNHIEENRNCACGANAETAKHYLIECTRYENIRNDMISEIPNGFELSLKTILEGDDRKSEKDNEALFKATTKFITKSNRFN